MIISVARLLAGPLGSGHRGALGQDARDTAEAVPVTRRTTTRRRAGADAPWPAAGRSSVAPGSWLPRWGGRMLGYGPGRDLCHRP